MVDTAAARKAEPGASHLAGSIRLYWEVARRGYRRYAAYRAATLAGIFTNTVFGFLRAYILIALFSSRPHIGGYTMADVLTYTWLNQAALMMVSIWGWYDIAERIRSGDIATDFHRPMDFQGYWLAQDLGRALYHAVFRGVPPFIIGALFFHLFLPHNPLTFVLFVISLAFAVGVSFAMRFIVNILAFWLMDYRGVSGLAAVFWTFLSGSVVPLAIFPPTARAVAQLLPFAGMIQTPIDIFLEKPQGWGLVEALGLQVFWTVTLLLVGRRLLAAARRKMVVQGG
ncbi:MAG: ABC transporter permease [Chloroflexota bacterium]